MAEEPGKIPETNSDQPEDVNESAQTGGAAVYESPPAQQGTEYERAHATEIKPPGARRRISYALFNRETRTGRFLRGLLRWLLIVVILLLAGFLATYYWLYRPAEQSLNQERIRATESAVDLQRMQKELEDAQTSMSKAQTSEQEAKERLDIEQTRVRLLRAAVSLRTAQAAIASEDKAAAKKALADAQQTLQQSQTRLNKIDSKAMSTLQALFTLVQNEIDRDLEIAAQDLERLIAEVDRLELALK